MAGVDPPLEWRGSRNIGIDELQRGTWYTSFAFFFTDWKNTTDQAWAILIQFLYTVDIKNMPLDVNGMLDDCPR